jgi:3-deoxy-D-manno-octulosonate 8-phosphate phosphatase (KDO 8-P phosphatase)
MNDKTKRISTKPGFGPGDAEVLRRLGKVKLLCLDVDGVLTDGGIYYSDDGHITRKYNVKDGVGIKRAMQAGVEVAIITAGVSGSVPERAKTLGVRHVFSGVEDKLAVVTQLCEALKIDLDAVAHIGDDLNDVPLMEAVGCPITVADADETAFAAAQMITEKKGGEGAVREICDLLVKARQVGKA